jgi:Mrp family chromosome partitioning ATPase
VDLAEHFRVIVHNWWRILMVSVLIAGAAYYLSGRRDDVYEATARLAVTVGNASLGDATRDQTVFLTETYAERATTRPVVADAVERAAIDGLTVSKAEADVSASESSNLGFLTISAEAPRPSEARRLANALAAALIADVTMQQNAVLEEDLAAVNREIESLSAQLNALPSDASERDALQARYEALLQAAVDRRTQPQNQVAVIAPATTPTSPVSPQPIRDALLAFLVALIITAELAVVLHALSDRLPRGADPETIGRLLGLPVLATVPRTSGAAVTEAFRSLRASLLALPAERVPRSVAIVGATESAGKSFTAINLARSAAAQQAGGVLLIDADLRRPVIHQRLGIDREPGLTDILESDAREGTVQSVGVGKEFAVRSPRRFLVIPSGRLVQDPVATLSGDALERAIAAVPGELSLVIVDTPPAALFGDASAIASQCDHSVLVIDARSSRVRPTKATIATLERSGVVLLGIAVNRAPGPRRGRYY